MRYAFHSGGSLMGMTDRRGVLRFAAAAAVASTLPESSFAAAVRRSPNERRGAGGRRLVKRLRTVLQLGGLKPVRYSGNCRYRSRKRASALQVSPIDLDRSSAQQIRCTISQRETALAKPRPCCFPRDRVRASDRAVFETASRRRVSARPFLRGAF